MPVITSLAYFFEEGVAQAKETTSLSFGGYPPEPRLVFSLARDP
jgi:hypothetical protein